ncbi:VIT1/CCC1 transporter family protein, partial [Treponema sp. OttesenSCG-928-L16]|nr:VIT1/CCC1 transporter family protein [Treponema sp. OttesenSCG-928-L16]
MDSVINEKTRKLLLKYQRMELTDHAICSHIAHREKDEHNRMVLLVIAIEEKNHAELLQGYTGQRVTPNLILTAWYCLLTIFTGYTFVVKQLMKNEARASAAYEKMLHEIPQAQTVISDHLTHERSLGTMLDEDRLQYMGAMVLGLNDALVELTGTIAGLTFVLVNTRLIALSGIITGISATLSMAASNYLAERADGKQDALKCSLYTGMAYLATVVCLVLPYLLFPKHMYVAALCTMLGIVILIILFFNYYISVAKDLPFGRRFAEMAGLSLGVALISFFIGLGVK